MVSSFGPQLLAKVLGANETQASSLSLVFDFADGEAIYTEQSQKYSRTMIERMAAESQFLPAQHFTDAQGLFCLSHWRVA